MRMGFSDGGETTLKQKGMNFGPANNSRSPSKSPGRRRLGGPPDVNQNYFNGHTRT